MRLNFKFNLKTYFLICILITIIIFLWNYKNNSSSNSNNNNNVNGAIVKKVEEQNIIQNEFITLIKGESYSNKQYYANYSLFNLIGKFKLPNNNDKFMNGDLDLALFPTEKSQYHDFLRIYNQLRFVPYHIATAKKPPKVKKILLYNGYNGYSKHKNLDICPVKWCDFTTDKNQLESADVVVWLWYVKKKEFKRPPNQIWVFFFHEPPYLIQNFSHFDTTRAKNQINWTMSYRYDSTFFVPYFKYFPYDLTKPEPKKYPLPTKNYAAGKTKLIAWMSSNCGPFNRRLELISELSKLMHIDKYGRCGNMYCAKSSRTHCYDLIRKEYKFYLALENSNCRDYISEKFFENSLLNGVVPVVMGAHPDDYKRAAPPNSYIHIEDFLTFKELVDYLHYLDKNDTAYNEYFAWKPYGTIIDYQLFWCPVCAMAHEAEYTKTYYHDIEKWWFGYKSDNNSNNKYPGGTRICTRNMRWD